MGVPTSHAIMDEAGYLAATSLSGAYSGLKSYPRDITILILENFTNMHVVFSFNGGVTDNMHLPPNSCRIIDYQSGGSKLPNPDIRVKLGALETVTTGRGFVSCAAVTPACDYKISS